MKKVDSELFGVYPFVTSQKVLVESGPFSCMSQ